MTSRTRRDYVEIVSNTLRGNPFVLTVVVVVIVLFVSSSLSIKRETSWLHFKEFKFERKTVSK